MKTEEIINVTIPFKKVWKKNKDGSWTGKLAFRYADCIARVSDDNEKEIGEIGARMGGGYQMSLKDDRETDIYATAKDIWAAYCKAIKKEDLIL